jgi:hypothetical protein
MVTRKRLTRVEGGKPRDEEDWSEIEGVWCIVQFGFLARNSSRMGAG